MPKQEKKDEAARNVLPSQKRYYEKPISSVYSVIDTDLARDNVENDLTAADLQDL